MKKTILSVFIISLCLLFSACQNDSSSNSEMLPPSDTQAAALFGQAVNEIIFLASEDPLTNLSRILGDDIQVLYEEQDIDGAIYYKTTEAFADLQKFYSEKFTGNALEWVLSSKFVNVDGVLYCSPIGGASGWQIDTVEVAPLSQKDGQYTFEAQFNCVYASSSQKEPTKSRFTIQSTDDGYRISEIDYVPDLLEKN